MFTLITLLFTFHLKIFLTKHFAYFLVCRAVLATEIHFPPGSSGDLNARLFVQEQADHDEAFHFCKLTRSNSLEAQKRI